MLELNDSLSVAGGGVSWETGDNDDFWRAGGPVKATAFCGDKFDGFTAGFFVGLREEDVEGVDLFIGEGEGKERDPEEDRGDVGFHWSANL